MREVDALIKAGCPADVVAHCREVSRLAVFLVDRMRDPADRELGGEGGPGA